MLVSSLSELKESDKNLLFCSIAFNNLVRREEGSDGEWEAVKQVVHWGRVLKGVPTRPDLQHGKLPGWPERSYAMRVAAWYFLNAPGTAGEHPRKGLSWEEFQRRAGEQYAWQADHTAPGSTADCFVEQLELLTLAEHRRRTKARRAEFQHSCTHLKRPAAGAASPQPRKRPATR